MHPVHLYDMMLRKNYDSFQDEQVKSDKGHTVPQRMIGAAEMHGRR
jgi:hypothetical protein